MMAKKTEAPVTPTEDDVLRRMLTSPPKPHDSKPNTMRPPAKKTNEPKK